MFGLFKKKRRPATYVPPSKQEFEREEALVQAIREAVMRDCCKFVEFEHEGKKYRIGYYMGQYGPHWRQAEEIPAIATLDCTSMHGPGPIPGFKG